jgi:hypothetical protein
VPLWMLRPLHGARVAIRMQRGRDRTRRLILDDSHLYVVQEEWRCARCDRWVERGAVTWVKSGRAVSEVPEVAPFCAACGTTPPAQRPV